MNNQNRRDFIKTATVGSLGILALGKMGCTSASAPEPGIQLYTVRDAMAANPREALAQVAGFGYKNLELAGYNNGKFYGMAPEEFKKVVEDLGMKIISSHTGVEVKGVDTGNAQKMAEDHAKIGVKYCVQPWLVEERRKTADLYRQFVDELNLVAQVMDKNGIKFGYHNHDFEFMEVDGVIPFYDIYLKNTDPKLVTFEIDLYWTTKAGHNPVEIFNKYPDRFELWHVKDMENSADKFFAPVGTGTINFQEIFEHKDEAGMKYYFVEQDSTRDNNPMDAIKTSIDNLNNRILKK